MRKSIILTLFLMCLLSRTQAGDIQKSGICCEVFNERLEIKSRAFCLTVGGKEIPFEQCLIANKKICCKDQNNDVHYEVRQQCERLGLEAVSMKSCERNLKIICCETADREVKKINFQNCRRAGGIEIDSKICKFKKEKDDDFEICCAYPEGTYGIETNEGCKLLKGIMVNKSKCK
ncbi:MAG: hypothetical protein A3I68_05655 [Candidatus Melainabacteria bacterium RIFCSPLOWO2_02_FULL_35_15]|nr:MAG: hypothetical protein A3F80_00695 [Candidatus Melainabacteria bacterium RIFCSPLOWO2_12_FULL_35_11]OGI13855.1 MAG: hypothetical protein A3I68_05655 [Candidatus Melainabacteria bacterium RIFCSPLOWO2_02_FULL_35_15]